MIFVYPISAAIVCAVIEWIRISIAHGQKTNINKVWTYTIGALFFGISLAFSLDYYDNSEFFKIVSYGVCYAACRGVVYDPLLNVLRYLPVDYKSKSTNSVIDRYLNINFYLLRFIYLLIAAGSAYIYSSYE